MKSYRELTSRYLKSHKKRTILTIIGIILSTALLCAVGILGETLQNGMLEAVKHETGNLHVSISGVNDENINMLQNNMKIEAVGYRLDAAVDKISNSQALVISGSNKEYLDMEYISLDEGTMPKNDNEIVIERWVLDNMQIQAKIGDTITLNIAQSSDGNTKGSLSSNTVKKEFKITGILKNNDASQYGGSPHAFVTMDTAKKLINTSDVKYNAYVRIKSAYKIQDTIKEIQNSTGIKADQMVQNEDLLMAMRQSSNNGDNSAVLVIELIAIAVIVVATIAVIYNAFNISVLERIHQFGVLRSVGTTPSQIRNIVFGEAALLSITGIPIGILCGVAAVKGVIGIFSMSAASSFINVKVLVPSYVLWGTALLGLATVFLAAFGPAFTAGRVSPLEAILNNAKININKLKRRKHPVLQRIFGIEGVMASENLKRNKKRYFFTVFSIGLAVTLSIFFTSTMNMLNSSTHSDSNFYKDFAIDRPFTENALGFTSKDYQDVQDTPGVKNVYRVMQQDIPISIAEGQLTDGFKGYLEITKQVASKPFSLDSNLLGYRDAELQLCKSHLVKGSIDSRLMEEENGVIISQKAKIDGKTMQVSDYKVGDEIELMLPNPVKVKILGILDRTPLRYNAVSADQFTIITTEKVFNKLTGIDTFARFDVEVNSKADLSLLRNKFLDIAKRVPQGRSLDYSLDSNTEAELEVSVILYGLVAVISIIGILNIINTISTNIILRIREFGTLRAVGMTIEQVKKMIRIEGVFYGIIGSFYGGIAAYALAKLMYNYFSKIVFIPWNFSWITLLAAAIIAALTGILSSVVPLKRISEMDVVDAIRVEE